MSFTGPVDSLVYTQFMINVVGHNDSDISYCVYSDIFEILLSNVGPDFVNVR